MLIKVGHLLEYDGKCLLGKGAFGAVYEGRCSCHGRIAIKKVGIDQIDQETKEDELKNLDHSNVIRLFHTENDLSYRYYALEMCETSMDRIFPENSSDKPKYENKVLSSLKPEDVLLQLGSGLAYIHSSSKGIGSGETNRKPLVHRDVKPSNVLISIKQNEIIFKWADFGLCKHASKDRKTFTQSGVRGSRFWMAPEVMEMNPTVKTKGSDRSDVWAAGCVFFYYLTQGQYPFGWIDNDYETDVTLRNIKEGQPRRINELRFDNFARETIEIMIKKLPEQRIQAKQIANQITTPTEKKILYDNEQVLNSSNESILAPNNYTFSGKLNKTINVAVKLINNEDADPDLGWKYAKLDHPNVLKLMFAEKDTQFTYFAFELCAGSMDQIFLKDDHPRKYRGPLPSDVEVLVSLTKGLAYIHSQELVHGRIEPGKVMISATEPVVMKWGHFGIEKESDDPTSSLPTSNYYNHLAPEILKEQNWRERPGRGKMTKESDIWAAGAVFRDYVTKTQGGSYTEGDPIHSNPFKNFNRSQSEPNIPRSIYTGVDLRVYNPSKKADKKKLPFFARNVIEKMMARNPKERIELNPDVFSELLNENIAKQNECRDLCSSPVLTEAAASRIKELVEKEGVDLDGLDYEKTITRSNLSLLCQHENLTEIHLSAILYLLKVFQERNEEPKRNPNGTNALFWIFQHRLNHRTESLLGIVTLMLEVGIECDAMDPFTDKTILHSACENYKNEDLIQIIILITKRMKDDVNYLNAKDTSGMTVLHHLCKNYRKKNLVNIIKFLIEKKVNPEVEDSLKNTALHYLQTNYKKDNLGDIEALLLTSTETNQQNLFRYLMSPFDHITAKDLAIVLLVLFIGIRFYK